MNITTHSKFLASQRDTYEAFLQGCKDINRDEIRNQLNYHIGRLKFLQATELPLQSLRVPSSVGRSMATTPSKVPAPPINTPASKKPDGTGSTSKQTHLSNLKRGMRVSGASNLFTKPHTTSRNKNPVNYNDDSAGSDPEIDDDKSMPQISASKRLKAPVSPSENAARYAQRRSASGKINGVQVFKALYDHSEPDSDTIPANSKSRHTANNKTVTRRNIVFESDSTSDCIEVAHPMKAVLSPFEVAARAAEIRARLQNRNYHHADSSSSDDDDIPFKPTLRKVSSDGKNTKKTLAEEMDLEGAYRDQEDAEMMEVEQSSSQKQKFGGSPNETNLTN